MATTPSLTRKRGNISMTASARCSLLASFGLRPIVVMADAELTGAESLKAGDHGEVVRVASDIGAGLPKPECRLDDCDNAGPGHCCVVVCRARYHVGVRIDDNARMLISGRAVRPAVRLIFP